MTEYQIVFFGPYDSNSDIPIEIAVNLYNVNAAAHL